MFRNLEAEQARFGYTNQQMADKLGISRVSYENKKKTGSITITVQDRDLYEANKTQCRKDIEAFNQLVYAAEDERVTGGTADETEK